MPAKQPYFLDSNILVYAFERDLTDKKQIARELIADQSPWQISWQVIQEFSHVALHKFEIPLSGDYLSQLIELLLAPHCTVLPDSSLWQSAIRIQPQTQYRFYDALIVAAALRSGCSTLYSEDLQHGRQIGDLIIVNPFRSR